MSKRKASTTTYAFHDSVMQFPVTLFMFNEAKTEFVREGRSDSNTVWLFSWNPRAAEICLIGLSQDSAQEGVLEDSSQNLNLILYHATILDVLLAQCVDDNFEGWKKVCPQIYKKYKIHKQKNSFLLIQKPQITGRAGVYAWLEISSEIFVLKQIPDDAAFQFLLTHVRIFCTCKNFLLTHVRISTKETYKLYSIKMNQILVS